ncbi:DNA repair ATPase [Vibrio sp. SCSIO 43136]|uniref:DNA repair ATPase n=1 Tax=Vibrio sp. SCSIO 43136 TaxID=2819101 RepID=UPI002074FB88|nr:DNA repair ATPase [Vibrio sp. SCSIO 43136]USD65681.1 DNA repair ATPase [Vibrio sp. SCSIO 43136]
MSEINPTTVSESSAYEVLKARLFQQGESLKQLTQAFNQQRQQVFGGQAMELVGKLNVQTEARCVPIDMAQVNQQLLFGYQVQLGMKSVPALSDVFGLYQLHHQQDTFRLEPCRLEESFLADPSFTKELTELFTYYKDARLAQISRQEGLLYLVFQIGARPDDRKVFRFQIEPDKVSYLDSQGDGALTKVAQHDFDWTATTRDDHVLGDHPHISIQDKIFVECVGGDLTIKLENNTSDGQGIYTEEVDDPHQSVADASVDYAILGELIALRIKPHREKSYRYFIYNPINQSVTRCDALEVCGKALPEEHGILLSHGYVLANGESKQFDLPWQALRFFHKIASPNGEDMLYLFFNAHHGSYVAYTYNMIEKQFSAPIESHGYSLYPDGKMLVFQLADNAEASTLHPLRVWDTPFATQEIYNQKNSHSEQSGNPLFNLGNAELVRAISAVLSVCHLARNEEVTQTAFEVLLKQCQSTLDHYDWLESDFTQGIGEAIAQLMETAANIIGEFVKVQQLQAHAEKSLIEQQHKVAELVGKIKLAPSDQAPALLTLLAEVKQQVGALLSLKQQHYIDQDKLVQLQTSLQQERDILNTRLLSLLQQEKAYQPFREQLQAVESKSEHTHKASELAKLQSEIDKLRDELQLVSEEVSEIETEDPTQATRILELTAEVSSRLNTVSAKLRNKAGQLQSDEAKAEFGAQIKLLNQSVGSAMEQAETPEQCDNQLARLLGLLDKLESRFAQFDQFLAEIYNRRDEIHSLLENHKQQLVATIQRRVKNLFNAAEVTLNSVEKRVTRFEDTQALNTYFATDAMVQKLNQLSDSIREQGDSVKADDINSRLQSLKDQSFRSLRDNQDIFEQGGKVLRLGKHRFSVNQQPLDISIVEHQHQTCTHISGTDFYQPIDSSILTELNGEARLEVVSESADLYRAEYLAYLILSDAESPQSELSIEQLCEASKQGELNSVVQRYAAPRYQEGYIKGIHDTDATLILTKVLPIFQSVGLLRYSQAVRAQALLWWLQQPSQLRADYQTMARNALLMKQHLSSADAFTHLVEKLQQQLGTQASQQAAEYLVYQLGEQQGAMVVSQDALALSQDYLQFRRTLGWKPSTEDLVLGFQDHQQWLRAYTHKHQQGEAFVDEAAMIALCDGREDIKLEASDSSLTMSIEGLLGEHARLEQDQLTLVLDDFLSRSHHHHQIVRPQYDRYLQQRSQHLNEAKADFRLEEFTPRPLTSFVRNKLISDSYLPLIGDNLAKQMGTLGESKRTDLMGMLLLISPPGYGKTTLIEYVADKLGLVFMKVNGPSLGHQVTSLDPTDAPDSNAAREVEKINLALEMGNNVLLYLDDIQHTNPEFLQKFISLCDGSRRIEGCWQGSNKTYDMRGKKFAVVMAGNPYTETGEAFRIPDMLANRADIYNLGDMLSDQQQAFELSFIENSLTSNSVLAPLATRDLNDLYRFVRMAQGENIALSEMAHAYSNTQADEIVKTLTKLAQVQQVVLKVNQQYIYSAAQAEEYRVEPPFKLQGSYRNMNKLAEKISAVMTDQELDTLIADHYQGEAQTLAAGAEENLLKLGELRGSLTAQETQRWEEIKQGYQRNQMLGDSEDRVGQVVQQLAMLNQHIANFSASDNGQ